MSREGSQVYIQQLAQDVVSQICELDSAHSKELLGVFVSEMFRTVAEQERYEERRQRQEKAKQKAEIFKDKKAPVK